AKDMCVLRNCQRTAMATQMTGKVLSCVLWANREYQARGRAAGFGSHIRLAGDPAGVPPYANLEKVEAPPVASYCRIQRRGPGPRVEAPQQHFVVPPWTCFAFYFVSNHESSRW